ncbi:cell division protein FtsQ [Reichenbachiella agarivorans]|uniref:Cell division protein FtsQ n=1 Tax=Reichenbachiella agarivorans TaxID=2979464 RepID=A0ABY6CJQ3_9BACT|nr:cell division protein FtsQ [Reichenbachiella agarivorans]UXP30746.1 cell division protein FtsQ [Reichenbachiella agarivorans]
MNTLLKIWKSFQFGLVLLGLVIIIGFTNARHHDRYVRDVVVSIDNQYKNYFIDQQDVLNLINQEGKNYLLTSDIGALNLKELEQRIESHQFVEDAQAYMDLSGNLSVDVKQNRPIARVITRKGEDYYIGTKGDILPESAHYTARVLLIELENEFWLSEFNIKDSKGGEEVFELLDFLVHDKFWNTQIAAMRIEKDMDILLYPQVTKQIIEFGKAEELESKFRRLKTFYKEILPYKGWNTYNAVNLKYKDQIVCKQ